MGPTAVFPPATSALCWVETKIKIDIGGVRGKFHANCEWFQYEYEPEHGS
jgi:hypothetical protein